MSLLIVGSVAYDNIKTPFEAKENVLGGSATYSSLAASYFTKPFIVAVVGEDFSSADKSVLSDKNINLEGLTTARGKTFRWGGEYSFDLNSRTTLFTELNVFEQFNPEVPGHLQFSNFIFLGNLHPKLQQKVLEQMQNPKFVALDTMNYWIENAKQELLNTLKLINAIIINESEARELTGHHNIVKAANDILALMDEKKNPLLVIKRGEYGVLMFRLASPSAIRGEGGGENANNLDTFFLPAYPLEDVADPTGAGDSFAGGFMGYLSSQNNLNWEAYKKACVAGSTLASFCVEKIGTFRLQSLSIPDMEERLAKFKHLTAFEL